MKQVSVKKALQAWQGIQPISEKDRERLSRRFTIDYNYNSNHIEGNTLTYGQTEILLLFGKVVGEATVRDVQEMTASNVGLKMMTEEAKIKDMPLTQNFIRTLHQTLLREECGAGQYKTRPNSVITRYGDRFEYAAPEETAALMADLVTWYNQSNIFSSWRPNCHSGSAVQTRAGLIVSCLTHQKARLSHSGHPSSRATVLLSSFLTLLLHEANEIENTAVSAKEIIVFITNKTLSVYFIIDCI